MTCYPFLWYHSECMTRSELRAYRQAEREQLISAHRASLADLAATYQAEQTSLIAQHRAALAAFDAKCLAERRAFNAEEEIGSVLMNEWHRAPSIPLATVREWSIVYGVALDTVQAWVEARGRSIE